MEKETQPMWKRQRPYKNNPEKRLTQEEVYLLAEQIGDKQLKTLFVLIYLCGCRISELVRYEKLHFDTEKYVDEKGKERTRYLWKTRQVIDTQPSIKKRQIEFVSEGEMPILLVKVRNLKNKKKHTKDIPINLSRDWNSRMIELIKPYLDSKLPDDELFPFDRARAEYLLRKLPFNIHYLRDLRATHFVVINDMAENQLARIMGWSDSRPASTYVQYRWRDLVGKT